MKRIIDNRKKEKFMMDDAYLNGQAKTCGWQATLVYISLCRHSNKDQESFPSIELMREELNIGRNTVMKGLVNLEKFNVIQIEKTRAKNGKWLNNVYILIDKSQWIGYHVPIEDLVKNNTSHVPVGTQPCPSQDINQVPVEDTKETQREGNTYKETHTSEASSQFVWKDYLKVMEDSKRIDINLIAYFFERRSLSFSTKAEAEVAIRRHLRAAKDVSKFEKAKVFKAMDECDRMEKQKGIKWTLETIVKCLVK